MLAALAGLLVVVALVATVPSLRAQALLSLTHRNQPFVALGFDDPVPSRICEGLRDGTVGFRVSNAEGRDRSFRWSVALGRGGTADAATTRADGTVDVRAGTTRTVTARVARSTADRSVVVRLADDDRQVSVDCTRARS